MTQTTKTAMTSLQNLLKSVLLTVLLLVCYFASTQVKGLGYRRFGYGYGYPWFGYYPYYMMRYPYTYGYGGWGGYGGFFG